MKKVVQISSVHHSRDTRIYYKICRSLIDNGYSVDLIIQHEQDQIIDGLQIKALPFAKKKSDRVLILLPSILRMMLSYKKGTIVHFHDPELIPIGIILKLMGYKVIYDVHEDVPKTILEKDWIWTPLRRITALISASFEYIGNTYFDATIVVTKAIGGRFSRKVTLVQNYPILNHGQTESINHRKRKDLFYVGSISQVRGIYEMLNAIELVNEEIPIQLTLAGSFISQELKNEVRSNRGWDKTQFLGQINREQLKEIAESSLIGLVIFHPIPNHIEAQPNKLFEYMQYGLPIVGSRFDLWKDIVEENYCGILVDPLNPKEISEAIKWIFDNPDEAKKMGENGMKAVKEKYNWQVEEKKLIKLYEEISSV